MPGMGNGWYVSDLGDKEAASLNDFARICGDKTKKAQATNDTALEFGAGNRVRTGDLNLGKVALYQLSYSRIFHH